jgi:hypothetical protein
MLMAISPIVWTLSHCAHMLSRCDFIRKFTHNIWTPLTYVLLISMTHIAYVDWFQRISKCQVWFTCIFLDGSIPLWMIMTSLVVYIILYPNIVSLPLRSILVTSISVNIIIWPYAVTISFDQLITSPIVYI